MHMYIWYITCKIVATHLFCWRSSWFQKAGNSSFRGQMRHWCGGFRRTKRCKSIINSTSGTVIELSNSTTVARVQDALSHGKSMRYHMASQCVITWQVNALSHGKSMRHHMASQCVITWQVNASSHGKSMRHHMASQCVITWQVNALSHGKSTLWAT